MCAVAPEDTLDSTSPNSAASTFTTGGCEPVHVDASAAAFARFLDLFTVPPTVTVAALTTDVEQTYDLWRLADKFGVIRIAEWALERWKVFDAWEILAFASHTDDLDLGRRAIRQLLLPSAGKRPPLPLGPALMFPNRHIGNHDDSDDDQDDGNAGPVGPRELSPDKSLFGPHFDKLKPSWQLALVKCLLPKLKAYKVPLAGPGRERWACEVDIKAAAQAFAPADD